MKLTSTHILHIIFRKIFIKCHAYILYHKSDVYTFVSSLYIQQVQIYQ